MTAYDRAKISEIIAGHGDWFTADLLRLIARADNKTRERLAIAFPDEVNEVIDYLSPDGKDWPL